MRSNTFKLLKILGTTAAFCVTGASAFLLLYWFPPQCDTCVSVQAAGGWSTLGLSLIAYSALGGLVVDAIRLLSQLSLHGLMSKLSGSNSTAGLLTR